MKRSTLNLVLTLILSAFALTGLVLLLDGPDVLATTSSPGYDIVLPGQDAPNLGRPAPYGQFIVTHSGLSITTTANYGTVARTNGYDVNKMIMCDTGTYTVTANLYARVTSTGEVYTISTGTVFPASTNTISTVTHIAPWMSLRLTSLVTGSTTTCGIFVQTP